MYLIVKFNYTYVREENFEEIEMKYYYLNVRKLKHKLH